MSEETSNITICQQKYCITLIFFRLDDEFLAHSKHTLSILVHIHCTKLTFRMHDTANHIVTVVIWIAVIAVIKMIVIHYITFPG